MTSASDSRVPLPSGSPWHSVQAQRGLAGAGTWSHWLEAQGTRLGLWMRVAPLFVVLQGNQKENHPIEGGRVHLNEATRLKSQVLFKKGVVSTWPDLDQSVVAGHKGKQTKRKANKRQGLLSLASGSFPDPQWEKWHPCCYYVLNGNLGTLQRTVPKGAPLQVLRTLYNKVKT